MISDESKSKLQQIEENNRQLVAHSGTMERKPFRIDGYVNLLNRYGTSQDNSEAYHYALENQTPDTVLTEHYETNGLFAKIIDIPAQEAVKKGFKLNIGDKDVEEYIQKSIRRLRWSTVAEDSIKWSRLYGGAVGVMLIDDGAVSLDQPVNWKKARGIDEIVVYERPVVTPDYTSLYSDYGVYGMKKHSKFRMPEYYNIFSIYGSFRVHESRCLLFRNGKMPELASTSDYRFWGMPEYNRIKRAMRETITAHGDSVKLLERSVQAIYKMKNLSQILGTDEGEEMALKRLQVIDMARGILNSIAIDSEGEEYDFKSFSLTGVKEVIDAACNMLSALTEIPQTKLFGRSPAGMNSTGESDLENYYNFIDKIRDLQMKDNLCLLVDAVIQIGINRKELTGKPEYELEFESLWNEKESDRATTDQTIASTKQVRAQTAQLYVDMGVLDPSEVRKQLHKDGDWGIEDDELPEPTDNPFAGLLANLKDDPTGGDQHKDIHADSADDMSLATGVGVIVFKDGKVLIGNREDTNLIGGPGGHIEEWEDAPAAARRETEEEFGIVLKNLVPIGLLDNLGEEFGKSFIFLSTDFEGEPLTDTQEMHNNRFTDLYGLKNEELYIPFKEGVKKLLRDMDVSEIFADTDDNSDE